MRLNVNIEGFVYVDDFLICYERQLQLCLNKIEKWAMENEFRLQQKTPFRPGVKIQFPFKNSSINKIARSLF